eukprot:s2025_g14.t1
MSSLVTSNTLRRLPIVEHSTILSEASIGAQGRGSRAWLGRFAMRGKRSALALARRLSFQSLMRLKRRPVGLLALAANGSR